MPAHRIVDVTDMAPIRHTRVWALRYTQMYCGRIITHNTIYRNKSWCKILATVDLHPPYLEDYKRGTGYDSRTGSDALAIWNALTNAGLMPTPFTDIPSVLQWFYNQGIQVDRILN